MDVLLCSLCMITQNGRISEMEVQKNQLAESEIIRNLRRLIREEKIGPENRIYFFGANKSSLEMNAFLRMQGFSPEGFVDNSPKKQGSLVEGLPVLAPEDALVCKDSRIRVLIASEYHAQMCRQLEGLGFKRGEQVFVVFTVNDFYDTGEDGFEKHAGTARRGFCVYKRIMGEGESSFLFLCPYPGTGDIFLIGGYLGKYMEKNGISDAVAAVVNRPGEKILGLYGIRGLRTIVISQDESNDLVVFMRLMRDLVPGIILNDNYMRIMHRRLRGYKGIDFHTMFKYAVFGMEREDSINTPLSWGSTVKNRTETDAFFKQNGLVFGKTAVLSPYANTISNLPMEAWEEIADILKRKGYMVCTNSASDKEPAIKGTNPLFIPFSMAVPVLEAAGLFIAMRSGLCDIVAAAACRKVIFYPKGCIFGSCSTYEYFSLNAMGFCSDAVEIEFDTENYGGLLDYIREIP